MKINRMATAGAAIALTLAWASAPLAQPAPSAFTTENISAEAPFGDLPIDVAMINVDDIEAYLADLVQTLSPDQQAELEQRCVVISTNADMYPAPAVTLCTAVLGGDAGGM